MFTFSFQKLVRDKIVDHIIANGGKPIYKTLLQQDYIRELCTKLKEEVAEINETNFLDELADVQEIIDTLLIETNQTKNDLMKTQQQKREKNGGFEKKLYIETVSCDETYPWLAYYRANPDKYPLISTQEKDTHWTVCKN